MTVTRGVRTVVENFDRPLTLTTTPEGGTGWTVADTSSGGAPTYLTLDDEQGGAMKLLLANDTEVENVCMFHNDILTLSPITLHHVWFVAKTASLGTTTVISLGVGSNRNDDEDTVAESAWFKMEGADSLTAVVVESDDAVTNNDDIATGTTLSIYKKLLMDFTEVGSDGTATGAKGNIKFYIDGARVAAGTDFTMAGWTGAAGNFFQPMVQISKGSTTGTPSVTISQIGWQHSYAYGA